MSRTLALLRLAGTILAGAFAVWLSYQLGPADRSLFTLMGLYVMVTIGLSLLMGFAGQISLGQGAFYALGAYTAGVLTVGFDPDERLTNPQAGIDPALAVLAAPVVTAAVAALVGVPLVRLRGHYLAFGTLALHLVVLAFLEAQIRLTGGTPGLLVAEPLEIFGWQVTELTGSTPRHAAMVWGLVLVTLLVGLNLVRSRPGRALQGIATSERAAAAAGVNVPAYKLRLFVLSAGLAGLAGALYVFVIGFLSPHAFGIILSIQFVVMVAVGGLGSLYGAVFGAVAITWLDHELDEVGVRPTLFGVDLPAQAPEIFSVGVFGVILIVVMLFFPRGLLPGLGDALRRFTPARQAR